MSAKPLCYSFVLGALQCESLLKLKHVTIAILLHVSLLVLLSKSTTTFFSATNLRLVKMADYSSCLSVLPKFLHFVVLVMLLCLVVWHGLMLASAWKF